MNNQFLIRLYVVVCLFLLCGCEKFLDAKPYNSLAYPNSIKDLRALMDYESDLCAWYPGLGEIASDDFYVNYKDFSNMLPYMQDAYTWDDKGLSSDVWRFSYKVVSIANVVLEGLDRIAEGTPEERDNLRGEAHFLRGWVFFHLAQIYCAPYSVLEQSDGLGLVLRMDSDSEINMSRSSLQDTYGQIFSDLLASLELLPDESSYPTRPSRRVALAALARAYHTIEEYAIAEDIVDQLLLLQSDLLDFNELNYSESIPFNLGNNNELFNFAETRTLDYMVYTGSFAVNPDLYRLYEEDDLRKMLFFEENGADIKFKGFYHGIQSPFYGLAMDEIYLIKAECTARRGDRRQGEDILNKLLLYRYAKGRFLPLTFPDTDMLLDRILSERRKELLLRGIRWLDLRRLNRYSDQAVVLERKIEHPDREYVYRLDPSDLRYTFLIPLDAIEVGGYVQNPR